jgi:hypothetical protein
MEKRTFEPLNLSKSPFSVDRYNVRMIGSLTLEWEARTLLTWIVTYEPDLGLTPSSYPGSSKFLQEIENKRLSQLPNIPEPLSPRDIGIFYVALVHSSSQG